MENHIQLGATVGQQRRRIYFLQYMFCRTFWLCVQVGTTTTVCSTGASVEALTCLLPQHSTVLYLPPHTVTSKGSWCRQETPQVNSVMVDMVSAGHVHVCVLHYTGTGKGGQSIWGGKFEDEFHDSLKVWSLGHHCRQQGW